MVSGLDHRVWSSLPEDVLLHLLAFLPIKTLLRLRCVCRKWNKLITSEAFANLQSQVTPQLPWILMFECQCYRVVEAFDRSSNRWLSIRLPFLSQRATEAIAASGGLLCFRTHCRPREFIICNPLLRRCKELPPMRSIPSSQNTVALVTHPSSSSFKLVVAGSYLDDVERVTEVFDSTTNRWTVVKSSLPQGTSFAFRSETACCDGQVFFTTNSDPPALLSFDLDKSIWKKVPAALPDSLAYCFPVVTNGVLHLLGGIGSFGVAKRISIWKLVVTAEGEQHWKEINRMPDALGFKFLGICYHNYDQICCTGQKDLICLSCFTWPASLVYCIPRDCWMWLPTCEELPLKSTCAFRWFSFEPSLTQQLV